MTVQSDLQKAIASCESAAGTYAMFEQSTMDQSAKSVYQDMSKDMERHKQILESRLQYLNANNELNQQQQQKQQQKQQQTQGKSEIQSMH